MHWQNKNAHIFAGLRKGDDGNLQLAVLGYVEFDVEAKNYAQEWKLLPISVELTNTGARTSIGKPLPKGSPANIDKVRRGMLENDVRNLLGVAGSIEDRPSSAAAPHGRRILRFHDEHSHCLPPPAFASSLVALAASPLGAGPLA